MYLAQKATEDKEEISWDSKASLCGFMFGCPTYYQGPKPTP